MNLFNALPIPPRPLQIPRRLLGLGLLIAGTTCSALAGGKVGANTSWTSYEAESMRTTGQLLGPVYAPFRVEMESSAQRCVKLTAAGDYVEFTAADKANALVLRFSLPDSVDGTGTQAALGLYINGECVRTLSLSSHYAWVYGTYPFTNKPADGKPRNFYDELAVKDLTIEKGDVISLRKSSGDEPSCIVDLVDLEQVPVALSAPANALSLRDFGTDGRGLADDTVALRRCIAEAVKKDRIVWVPAGTYKITGDIVLPSSAVIQGAGIWHTTFVGDEALYGQADRRVRFKLMGARIRLADFAIRGKLDHRIDEEANDGIMGAGCSDSSLSRIWIEHTKVGVWIYNGTNLLVEGCRFRNLLADGINLCVGTSGCVVQDSSARGTGDDCFAIWPAPFDQGFDGANAKPGSNIIRHCTGSLNFLANGGAIYGGADNRIEDCLFTDINTGCGILISSSFPTADETRNVDNNFSGTTVVRNNTLLRCGGYDHTWSWRGALQICMERRSISGLALSQLEILDSLSDPISIVGPGSSKGQGTLSNVRMDGITIGNYGLGSSLSHALSIRKDACGSLTFLNSRIDDVKNDSPRFTVQKE